MPAVPGRHDAFPWLRPLPGHEICPYLLRGVSIERHNQVWSADMTYLPMHGVLHLVAVLVQSLRDQLGTLQHHGDRLLRRIIPSLVRPGRRNEDLPPENLLIKWRSRAGCGFNVCQPCVCSSPLQAEGCSGGRGGWRSNLQSGSSILRGEAADLPI